MSTIVTSNISDGTDTVGTEYVVNGSAKAWVNFDNSPMAVRTSLNVSSLTDRGVGQPTVNFLNAFVDAQYSSSGISEGAVQAPRMRTQTSTSVELQQVNNTSTSFVDANTTCYSAFR